MGDEVAMAMGEDGRYGYTSTGNQQQVPQQQVPHYQYQPHHHHQSQQPQHNQQQINQQHMQLSESQQQQMYQDYLLKTEELQQYADPAQQYQDLAQQYADPTQQRPTTGIRCDEGWVCTSLRTFASVHNFTPLHQYINQHLT